MLDKLLTSPGPRSFRRSRSIRAYVGANGSGKTAAAVWDLIPSLQAGRPCLSTARMLDFDNPRQCDSVLCTWPGHPEHAAAHPSWIPFVDFRQMLDFRDGDIFMDEVAGVASSRETQSLPFQIARDLQQLRKRGVTLSFTAPSFQRTDKIIRECTQLLTHCTGMFPKRVVDDLSHSTWTTNRVLRWRSYDAVDFDDFTNSDASDNKPKKNRLRPIAHQLFKIDNSILPDVYDTHDSVLSLGWANESGLCISCGGRRAAPRCSCSDHAPLDSADGPPAAMGEDGPPARTGRVRGRHAI